MTIAQGDMSQGFHLFLDGDAWCTVGPEFEDLQRSLTGFGDTQEAAVGALHAEMRKAGLAGEHSAALSRFKVHDGMPLTLPRDEIRPAPPSRQHGDAACPW